MGVAPADLTVAVYLEHRDELLNYANRIVRDRACAEDVVQEAWLRFSARSRQDGEILQPLNYLYTVVRNLALNWVKRTPHAVTVAGPALDTLADDLPSVEQVLYYRDELRVLVEAIAELPDRTRIAFRLYRFEGRSMREIADRLDVSVVRVH